MADYLRLWRESMAAQRLSGRTIHERATFIERLAHELGAPAHDLQAEQIVSWCARHAWRPNTAHTYWTHLGAWFEWLAERGVREDRPMRLIPAPRRPRAVPRPITTGQLGAVLRLPLRRRTRAMILLAALAGLRVSEIARFRADDIEADSGRLWVTGKGGVRETVPAHPLIVELVPLMPRQGLWFAKPGDPTMPVWPQNVGATITRAFERAGYRGVTAHMLRHWYATSLLDAGADLRTTQTLMRHASVATTERYTKIRDERRQAAVLRLDPFYDDDLPAYDDGGLTPTTHPRPRLRVL